MKKFSLVLFASLALSAQAQIIELPKPEMDGGMPIKDALMKRHTVRDFEEKELTLEQISTLLWAANGINRPDEGKRTAPSARNVQETDIYLFSKKGIFLYMPKEHALKLISDTDHRKDISDQKHFAIAPISLVLVANYDKMKGFDDTNREFYSSIDCGYVSQNIYLYCVEELGTVACGAINRDTLTKVMKLKNAKALLAHPIGYPAK